jgi:glycosyltransferase involved in cell wall biosynthesis
LREIPHGLNADRCWNDIELPETDLGVRFEKERSAIMPDEVPNPHPDSSMSSPPPVLILNQYYAPDVASTGHLLHELAKELASLSFKVKVITCRPCYGPPHTWVWCPLREKKDGVDVHRMLTTRFSKDGMIGRAINAATFFVPLFLRMLLTSRSSTVHLYTTNPPFLGIIGAIVSIFRRHRYVQLLHDSYPHLAVWVGKVRAGSFVERMWHRVNRLTYRRAKRTIVLCEAAKKLVCDTYGVNPERVHVIHNWADGQDMMPRNKNDSQFARDHGLIEPFTLMYSGNLGLYYEFETLLAAANTLRQDNFRLVLVGAGGRRSWIADEIKRRNLTNTLLLPYQPFATLSDSLSAADAQVVSIAKGIEGISFPSKLYSALSVGRPIIALSEAHSEMRRMVEDASVGRWFEIGKPENLVAGLRAMMKDPVACARMGRDARTLFEERHTIQVAAKAYGEILAFAREDA